MDVRDPYEEYLLEREDWRNEISKRDDEITELKKELGKRWDRIEELNHEVQYFRNKSDEAEGWLEENSKENQRLGAEINGLESEIKTLKHDLAHTQGNYELAQDRLQDSANNVLLSEADLENARKYIIQQNKYIEALEHDINHFKDKSEDLDKKLKDLEDWGADKNDEIFKLTDTIGELKEDLTYLHKQIRDVVDLVGDRYEEQGRVMMAFKVLEGIVEEEEE